MTWTRIEIKDCTNWPWTVKKCRGGIYILLKVLGHVPCGLYAPGCNKGLLKCYRNEKNLFTAEFLKKKNGKCMGHAKLFQGLKFPAWHGCSGGVASRWGAMHLTKRLIGAVQASPPARCRWAIHLTKHRKERENKQFM